MADGDESLRTGVVRSPLFPTSWPTDSLRVVGLLLPAERVQRGCLEFLTDGVEVVDAQD